MICRAIPYEEHEPYIFVSYCHQDKELIYPLMEQMVLDGYRIWYDDGNHAGEDWLDNIENKLEDCKVVIAFISNNSSLSHNCKSEITYALKCRKKVVPVLIDTADLPKGLRMQMSNLHYLMRKDFPSDKAMLNKAYESEGFKDCQAPAGSLKLKEVTLGDKAGTKTGKGGQRAEPLTDDFLDGLKRFHKLNNEDEMESSPTESAPVPAVPEKPKKRIVKKIISQKKHKTDKDSVKSIVATTPAIEILHESNKLTSVASVTDIPPASDNDPIKKPVEHESMVISRTFLDDDRTVYNHQKFDEGTVRDDTSAEPGDVTVLVSNRNLALLLHPAGNRCYILRKPQTKIGRSPIKCDIAIEGNNSISKHHADIIQYNQKCYIRDTNSTNGTYINGERIEPEKQVQLDNPAIFQLNDETLILVSGIMAHRLIGKGTISFLINEEGTAIRFMDADTLSLNRNNKWPDGTLSDLKVHRAAHALLQQAHDGIHLVDESPECGNGTYLNGKRLTHGESRLLENGDRIRLGDTTLTFVTICNDYNIRRP